MKEELYKTVQARLDENSEAIGKLFQDVLDRLKAHAGFFGYEDLEGYIRIFKCKGTYLHLPKDQGFVGTVYSTKKAAICPMRPGSPFLDSTGLVKAEMVAPISLDNEIIGVLLIDRHIPMKFSQEHLDILVSYAERLGAILSKREPWPFRTWWKKYDGRCIHEYRARLMPKLVSILKDVPNISAFTALVEGRERSNIVDLKPIESKEEKVAFKGRITDEVISKGKGVFHPEKVTREEFAVPFPHHGPIRGVIWVESYLGPNRQEDKTQLSTFLLSEIDQAVELTTFSHFVKTPDPSEPNTRFYSILLKCASYEDPIENIVEAVIEHTRILCDTDVHIYLVKENLGEKLKGPGIFFTITSEKELREKFKNEELKSFRPHFTSSSDRWVRCPVWIDDDLVACIEAKKKDESEVEYNGPVLEIVSTALANAFLRYREASKMRELTELCINSSPEESELLKRFSENARLILRANIFSVWDTQGGEAHLLASCEKPHLEKTQYESLSKVAQSVRPESMLINIKDVGDPYEFDRSTFVNIEELRNRLLALNIRAMIAKNVEVKPSHHVIFLACIIRGESFKPFFSVEDETTVNVLSGLFSASTMKGNVE